MIILIKLLLAHLIGDFLLQPDSWVKQKEIKKLKSYQLYLHVFIHFALIMLLVWDMGFWMWALLLTVIHLFIDVLKIMVQNRDTKRTWFFTDQFLHLVSIMLIWLLTQKIVISWDFFNNAYVISFITFVYFLTQPVSITIRSVISKWTPSNTPNNSESLASAGKYIGILERLFVFGFVLAGRWEGIGFLLASKSIFRFGDLKESKDRKLTEYVLIGTLLSFGIAIVTGVIFLNIAGFMDVFPVF